MTRDIKSTTTVLRALTHLASKGFEFELIPNAILHRVGKRRVRGLAILLKSGGALESPLVAIHNHLYDPKGIKVAYDQMIEGWSLPAEEMARIRQASADSPYANQELRNLLLAACGLKEIPLDKRPFVKRPT